MVTRRSHPPPFRRSHAKGRRKKCGWPKMAGIRAILKKSRWLTRSIHAGGTDRSSSTWRTEIVEFLSRKSAKRIGLQARKELWAFTENRIAVRFAYEWHDDSGHWYRSYGNENWEFNEDGFMAARFASINDLPISGSDGKYHWVLGRRPDDHQGLAIWGYSFLLSLYR